MIIVVTGVAGFIGSHLSEALLEQGHYVVGMDWIDHHVNENIKRDNIKNLIRHHNFEFINVNLLEIELEKYIKDAHVVFHLAAIAGVRNSWGSSFSDYVQANVLLTQRILEACKTASSLNKLIYASSSSVYGGGSGLISSEHSETQPISPYGLTKLAGEQLCSIYYKQYGIPFTALRYFTVYGPRQRPDMGFHRFMKAALLDEDLTIYGNGEQTRDFTFVRDVVQANISAMNYRKHGTIFNIGGVETASVNESIRIIEKISGKQLKLKYIAEQPGDPLITRADLTLAQTELLYNPVTSLENGMAEQWNYITKLYR